MTLPYGHKKRCHREERQRRGDDDIRSGLSQNVQKWTWRDSSFFSACAKTVDKNKKSRKNYVLDLRGMVCLSNQVRRFLVFSFFRGRLTF